MTPSSMASAWFTKDTSFDFSLSNTGNKSVTAGLIGDQHDQRCVSLGKYPGGHLFGCGFTFWIHGFVSSASCSPTCSSTLTISTSGSTPAGTSAIAVAATSGGLTRTTSISPNGGSFTSSVSVMLQTATSGGSIYYTTDGSAPTQSSTLYVGALALTSSATVKAIAFKSGSNPSAVASAAFTVGTPPAQLTLTWQDNSTNESNFGVERKTGTNGIYAQIALVAANTTSYVDTSVTHGVTIVIELMRLTAPEPQLTPTMHVRLFRSSRGDSSLT